MKACAGEYRPKQTDYDIADGINRSFAKKDSSKFIKFINGVGLFVDHLENMTDFGETETLPIFRFLRGFVPDHSIHGYALYVFIIVIIQQNLGRNRMSGNSQTIGPSRASQTMLFVGILGCFLVLRKLLFVSFCVVVWVLFSVFSIFCITSLVSATPRNHRILPLPFPHAIAC